MIDKKKVQNFRTRIRKAQNSFGVMGDMLLHLEIDAMHPAERKALKDALEHSKAPLRYDYLTKKVMADYKAELAETENFQ